jgi:hypothetical protein
MNNMIGQIYSSIRCMNRANGYTGKPVITWCNFKIVLI